MHEQRRETVLVRETTELIGNLMNCFEAEFGVGGAKPLRTATPTRSQARTASPRVGRAPMTPSSHIKAERLERLAKYPVSDAGTPQVKVCVTKTGLVATPPSSQCMRAVGAASPSPERKKGPAKKDSAAHRSQTHGPAGRGPQVSPRRARGGTPPDVPLHLQHARFLAESPSALRPLGLFGESSPPVPPPPPHPLSPVGFASPAQDAASPRRDREFITALLRSLQLDEYAACFEGTSLLGFYRLTAEQLEAMGLPPSVVRTLATSIDQIKLIADMQSPVQPIAPPLP
eukprot:TRINITY_DN7810_c0_g1_i1.p2 TRINITY_DN7810_c0_g1~~TRINITY_DN7810_c0_g1_i1.p2  ORF type:complete len:323 (+),score=105.61 TRINITY_DN7810_c0_g1_i1:111-971(+)